MFKIRSNFPATSAGSVRQLPHDHRLWYRRYASKSRRSSLNLMYHMDENVLAFVCEDHLLNLWKSNGKFNRIPYKSLSTAYAVGRKRFLPAGSGQVVRSQLPLMLISKGNLVLSINKGYESRRRFHACCGNYIKISDIGNTSWSRLVFAQYKIILPLMSFFII